MFTPRRKRPNYVTQKTQKAIEIALIALSQQDLGKTPRTVKLSHLAEKYHQSLHTMEKKYKLVRRGTPLVNEEVAPDRMKTSKGRYPEVDALVFETMVAWQRRGISVTGAAIQQIAEFCQVKFKRIEKTVDPITGQEFKNVVIAITQNDYPNECRV